MPATLLVLCCPRHHHDLAKSCSGSSCLCYMSRCLYDLPGQETETHLPATMENRTGAHPPPEGALLPISFLKHDNLCRCIGSFCLQHFDLHHQ